MKRGITLAILSVIILVMVILATAATITGSTVLNNSKKIKFGAELALVQDLVDEYVKNNSGEYPVNASVDTDLANVTESSITQFDEETKNGTKIVLYEVDFSKLTKTNLIYGKGKEENDIYAVSKDTGRVYYLKGIKVNSKTYYTLTEDLKDVIGYVSKVDTLSKDGLIFSQSTTKWTNQNITSTLKVPNSAEYTGITVSVMQNGYRQQVVEISETLADYKVYNVSGITGNYDIQVAYTKNGDYTTQYFTVTNFDNVKPSVTVTKKQGLVNEDDGVKEHYISLDIVEDISGVKYAKYETESITTNVKQYFTNSGMNISNNTITANKYTQYVTIYVEDNAGNYTSQVVTLDVIVNEKDYAKNGLIIHYDGTNNTGSGHSSSATIWKNLAANNYNGELKNFDYTSTSGWSSDGLKFDGSNDWVRIGECNLDNVTLEAVVKYDIVNDAEVDIISNCDQGGHALIRTSSTNRFAVYTVENSGYVRAISENRVQVGKLYSLSGSYNNIKVVLYENGKKTEVQSSGTISKTLNNTIMILGMDPNGDGPVQANYNYQFLDGEIKSIRIYNRALTEKEVMQNYKIDKIRYGL